jgi:hypothetical protein
MGRSWEWMGQGAGGMSNQVHDAFGSLFCADGGSAAQRLGACSG